jgi:hypothetical protein
MIREHLLWDNGLGAPLVVLIPGGTGAFKDSISLGYPASAGFFWLYGYSCYIASTAGQDGNPGVFSLSRCLDECRHTLSELANRLRPSQTILFGSCSGGTVATHLAAENVADVLFLWEALPRYDEQARCEFGLRARGRVALSERFAEENLDTVNAASSVHCPVFCLYGIEPQSALFLEKDADDLEYAFSSALSFTRFKLNGAEHTVTRGSDATQLRVLLEYVAEQAGRPEQ